MTLEGHEVAVWVRYPVVGKAGIGIFERPASWREKLKWADLVVCDAPGMGVYEPVLQALGVPYLGCSTQVEILGVMQLGDLPVDAVDVTVGGFFNGREWLHLFTHSFPETRLFVGNLGPVTRGMGAVVIGRESNRLTKEVLEPLAPSLVRAGWRGSVSVRCLVDCERTFVLETIGGFDFDAIEAVVEGLGMGLGVFLQELADGTISELPLTPEPMIAVRASVPPYPYKNILAEEDCFLETGMSGPVRGVCEENSRHLFLAGVWLDEAGEYRLGDGDGVVLKATARGSRRDDDPLDSARRRVYRTLGNLTIGGLQYRLDVGARVKEDLGRLIEWGWVQKGEVL